MKLGIEQILSGMLVDHPNHKEKVIVEWVVKQRDEETYGIYWKKTGASMSGGFLRSIPKGTIFKIDDPILQDAMRGAADLLDDIWEDGGGWNFFQQYKVAARLIQVKMSTLTRESLQRQDEDSRLRNEIKQLRARFKLILRAVLETDQGDLTG